MATQPTQHPSPEGHEGATESTAPGAPAERPILKPDWVSLENDPLKCDPDAKKPRRESSHEER
jgi:hypothetical protein